MMTSKTEPQQSAEQSDSAAIAAAAQVVTKSVAAMAELAPRIAARLDDMIAEINAVLAPFSGFETSLANLPDLAGLYAVRNVVAQAHSNISIHAETLAQRLKAGDAPVSDGSIPGFPHLPLPLAQ